MSSQHFTLTNTKTFKLQSSLTKVWIASLPSTVLNQVSCMQEMCQATSTKLIWCEISNKKRM